MKAGELGRRRSDIVILAVSIVISFAIWLIHYLSQDYMAYFPFRICVETSLDGYAPSAVSNETVILGGQATGFYILRKRSDDNPLLTVPVKKQSFTDEGSGRFSLAASSVRESLSDAVGSDFKVSYIQDMNLTFDFVPQSFVKVPVNSLVSVSCRPQYMQASEIVIKPDSVTVYGSVPDLNGLTGVDTKVLALKDVNEPVNGVIGLSCGNFRVEPDMVEFFVDVKRYVEHRFTATITSVDVPEGKTLISLPSRVEVTCRLPFGVKPYTLQEPGAIVVDYDDFLASRSTRVAPKIVNRGVRVLEFSTNPEFVDCILSESY